MNKTFTLILFLVCSEFMGQIILSQTNEHFEDFVNDIVRQNTGKRLEFAFTSNNSGRSEKTEIVKIDWEKPDVIIIGHASTDFGLSLSKLRTNKYRYVDGYFADLTKGNGDYNEVSKISDKKLLFKSYREGKLVAENRITLNDNRETILSDHSNYYYGSKTRPVRTITSYSKKIVDK